MRFSTVFWSIVCPVHEIPYNPHHYRRFQEIGGNILPKGVTCLFDRSQREISYQAWKLPQDLLTFQGLHLGKGDGCALRHGILASSYAVLVSRAWRPEKYKIRKRVSGRNQVID